MPAHVQQRVLQRLIPMLVMLTIAAALPAALIRSQLSSNGIGNIDQPGTNGKESFHHIPRYEFAYGVKDPITGDHKDHWEKRDGDHVQGVYTFEEADGTQRIVEYEADDVQGFRAIVTSVELPKAAEPPNGEQRDPIAHSYNMLRASS